jgi:hypothetical protein
MHIKPELLEPLPNGLPRVSRYDEFLRITGETDSPDTFIVWTQAAFTLMQPSQKKQ